MLTNTATDSYAGWCRRIVKESAQHPHAYMLFDSSIQEPTALLLQHVTRCFGEKMSGYYRSTFNGGNSMVLDALAARYAVHRDDIICTSGATSGAQLVMMACVEDNDHVIVERPYFDVLPSLARQRGAQVGFIDREPGTYGMDVERLAAMVQPNTRLIVLTNLHNPSGTLLSDAELLEIAVIAERHGIPVLLDEVYADFAQGPLHRGPACRLSTHFVSINSLTKVYGLDALKCGWLMARGELRRRIHAVYERFEFGLSRLSHAVAASMFENFAPLDAHWRQVLHESRPLVVAASEQFQTKGLLEGRVPEYGCMWFPRLCSGDDLDAVEWLWRNDALAVAPGSYFGMPGHLRIGFGRDSAEVTDGLVRLERGLSRYLQQDLSA